MIEPAFRTAALQGGIATREQLLNLGVTARQIERRLETGAWIPVVEGVYRILRLTSWRDRLAAAVAGLPNAVASHSSAARLLSLPIPTSGDVVVTVHSKTTHFWPDATVRRSSDLSTTDITTAGRIAATSPVRTLFDLSADLPEPQFIDLADTLASTGIVPTERLDRLARRLCRRGKAGSGVVRRYLIERSVDAGGSPLETRAIALLRQAGLSPIAEFPIPWSPSERFDMAFPEQRVAIELDSIQWHSTPDRFQADRRRDREAILRGWRVLRFTWRDVEEQPTEMVAIAIQTLALRPDVEA